MNKGQTFKCLERQINGQRTLTKYANCILLNSVADCRASPSFRIEQEVATHGILPFRLVKGRSTPTAMAMTGHVYTAHQI